MLKRLLLTGLMLSGVAGAGLVFANTLNGFEIQTDPASKSVQILLNTTQKASVTTQKQGKQISIVLDNVELSQEQLDQGLPVVLDNHNKFIGRAVPVEGGKVKVIIPNLPANEYDVSVLQKYPGGESTTSSAMALRPVASPSTGSALTPRPSASAASGGQFENIAKTFPEPVMPKKQPEARPATGSTNGNTIKLSPAPSGVTGAGLTAIQGGYPIWNPYVVAPGEQQPLVYQSAHQNTGQQTVTRKVMRKKVRPSAVYDDSPINTLSVEELRRMRDERAVSAPMSDDPLSVLHAIPPFGTEMAFNGIPDLSNQPIAGQTPVQAQPLISVDELKAFAKRLPWWVYAIAGAFFVGVGLFTLIGTLVLLKMLFAPTQRPLPAAVPGWGQQVNIPNQVWSHAPIGVAAPGFPMAPPEQEPEPLPASVSFEDTSAVNPFELFKDTPTDVKSAVHNTILLKFPDDPKRRRLAATDEPPRPKKRRKLAML